MSKDGSQNISTETMKDGRGFQKTENFEVMNPNEANFQTAGM